MNFVPRPEPKIAESTAKILSRLDRIKEAMRLTAPELNNLLINVLGIKAPTDYRQLNSSQAMHVIRYIARNGAKILLHKSENAKRVGNK